MVDVPVTVINKPASGGVVAWMGLNHNPMDGQLFDQFSRLAKRLEF